MIISLFPTPFDHFHFHGSAGLVPKLILTPCHRALRIMGPDTNQHTGMLFLDKGTSAMVDSRKCLHLQQHLDQFRFKVDLSANIFSTAPAPKMNENVGAMTIFEFYGCPGT